MPYAEKLQLVTQKIIAGLALLVLLHMQIESRATAPGIAPGVLTANLTNPTTSPAAVFAGQVLALRPGSAEARLRQTRGKTVDQVLALANTVLGGNSGALPAGPTLSELNNIVEQINRTSTAEPTINCSWTSCVSSASTVSIRAARRHPRSPSARTPP